MVAVTYIPTNFTKVDQTMKKTNIALLVASAFSVNALAIDDNDDWIVRVGVAHVSPNGDSARLADGSVLDVDSGTNLAFSGTYRFDSHWGVEVLAALPFKHDIDLDGEAVAETKHLPPTISAVYQWGDKVKYHAAIGLNYTKFFDEAFRDDSGLSNVAKLELESSTGAALKFGFDAAVSDDWNINASIRYITIDTKADIVVDGIVQETVNVDIDPWVFMLGVSTSF